MLVYADEQIGAAVARAVAVEGARGWKISKEKQSHKIDIVISLGMASLAAVRAQSEPFYDTSYAWLDGTPGDDPDPHGIKSFERAQLHAYINTQVFGNAWGPFR
jgi:hypothetical protein